MTPKVDYYTSLSRAIARIDRDSYEARGAVYDRALNALLKRMASSDPPYTDVEIAREKRAFKDAVRRIEFGDGPVAWDEQDEELEQAEQYQQLEPELPPPPPQSRDLDLEAPRDLDLEVPPEVEAPPTDMTRFDRTDLGHFDLREERRPPADYEPLKPVPKRRSIMPRVAARLLFAVLVLAACGIGYAFVTDDFDLSQIWKRGDGGRSGTFGETGPQQAIVFDDDPTKPDAAKAVGTAAWSTVSESSDSQRKASAVLQLDLAIPARHLAMKMSMRRDPFGGAMSHLMEIRFVREDQQPDADIADIGGIIMTTSEHTRRAALAGQVVKVTPGVFLFGLSGEPADQKRNLGFLQELTWLDIPISYRNGAKGVLSVEKGAGGEQAVKEAVAQWAQ